MRFIIAAALVALGLTSCGEGNRTRTNAFLNGAVEIVRVERPLGGTVECAVFSEGGIDCDWGGEQL